MSSSIFLVYSPLGGVVGVSNFLLDGLATLTVKAGKTVYNVACDAEVGII